MSKGVSAILLQHKGEIIFYPYIVWATVSADARWSKDLWKFQVKKNTCLNNHSYYQRKQYLPEKIKTTACPLVVNVPYHFLLCLPTFTAWEAEAHTVRKSYCTSFAHAPDWFHCYGILFIPCGGWKINQNYNAILTVIIIAVKWSHWSASWVFKMKMLWSSTVHLVYAV